MESTKRLDIEIETRLVDDAQYGKTVFRTTINAGSFEEAKKLLDKTKEVMEIQHKIPEN